jgi:glycosyltransferase involved in cell wall biosynthesis/2-polyprenyl-3-methyl-5-hydroxy-6-metoxy-1,4-benzoquinol methylase
VTASLRVLIVSDVSPLVVLGGSERVIWEQARRLAARGHRVRVVARRPEAGGALAVDREGVEIRHFEAPRRPAWRFIGASIVGARRRVAREVRDHGADVLHFHQPLSAFGALTSSALRRLPSLYTFHSPAALEYQGRRGTTAWHRRGLAGGAGAAVLSALERWSLARVTRVHALSAYSAGLLRSLHGIDGERVVRIEGGVDTLKFRPPDEARDAVRAELGWPAGGPVLFTLRNLQPRMGLDELIRAVDLLRRRMPDLRLVIGGEGALRAELAALVERLGLGGHVSFLGFVDESRLARCYQATDVFVLPTQALEGFGLVTVEALACGTPVLGTPVGATPEILAPLAKSLLLSGTTAAAMADDLARFLDELARDPAAAGELRRACRRHVESHYGWDHSVARLEATLAALAAPGDDRCPACGCVLGAGLALDGREFRRCAGCGTRRQAVLPTPVQVRHHYEVTYPRRFDHAQIAPPRRHLFRSIADTLTTLRAPGRLLDIGCGGGRLTAEAARAGWCAVASDLSHEACRVTHEGAVRPAVQSEAAALPVRARSFEALTLLNVVDHTIDPLEVIREAHRVLVPGGVMAIRVTNAGFHVPLARALCSSRWAGRLIPLHPVLHLWSFTPRGLRALVEHAGFVVVSLGNSPPVTGRGRAMGALRASLSALAAAVATGTGGRWLVAPAIELYARRPADASAEP